MMPDLETEPDGRPAAASIALVILAAGAGKRMPGSVPKQLLPTREGMPLLQKTVNAAQACLESMAGRGLSGRVLVVLGANSEAIKEQCDLGGCSVLVNDDWTSGMSSSIRLAINDLQKSEPEVAGVLLVVADQPGVSAAVLEAPIACFEKNGASLVVSSFKAAGSDTKTPGPPAFFAHEYFDELLALEGDVGARKVVLAHSDTMQTVDFPDGGLDIDTPSDYKSYLASGT